MTCPSILAYKENITQKLARLVNEPALSLFYFFIATLMVSYDATEQALTSHNLDPGRAA